MREILFRGKRIRNDEWVIGNLLMFPDLASYICCPDADDSETLNKYSVDPETVGEYTGLNANGKKIFEGDIVDLECDPGLNELWVFDHGNCGGVQNVAHDVGYMGFYLRPLSDNAIKARDYGQRDDPIYYLNALRLRIVGNIHDNPELLKGGNT